MNIILKNHLLVMSCFLLASASYCLIHADENTKEVPPIKATWTPSFSLGYVTLSITNQSNDPIKVARSLDFQYEGNNSLENGIKSQEVIMAGIIQASIVFILTPGMDYSDLQRKHGGVQMIPIEIAPGETKVIKFPVDDLVSAAKKSSQATFSLSWNDKELNKVIMTKLDNIWKGSQ